MFEKMDASSVWPPEFQIHDEIDRGGFDETCSIDDFMTYHSGMSNGEVSDIIWVDGFHLTVFWHRPDFLTYSSKYYYWILVFCSVLQKEFSFPFYWYYIVFRNDNFICDGESGIIGLYNSR